MKKLNIAILFCHIKDNLSHTECHFVLTTIFLFSVLFSVMLLNPVLFSVILLERTRSECLGVDSFATYTYSCRLSAWQFSFFFFSQKTIENSHVRSRRLSLTFGDSRALTATLVYSRRLLVCALGNPGALLVTLVCSQRLFYAPGGSRALSTTVMLSKSLTILKFLIRVNVCSNSRPHLA